MVYFGTLICPFNTKSFLHLHGFLLTRLCFQSLKKQCKQKTPCTFLLYKVFGISGMLLEKKYLKKSLIKVGALVPKKKIWPIFDTEKRTLKIRTLRSFRPISIIRRQSVKDLFNLRKCYLPFNLVINVHALHTRTNRDCLDVWWWQLIKLIQVVSTSEFHEYWFYFFFVPSI